MIEERKSLSRLAVMRRPGSDVTHVYRRPSRGRLRALCPAPGAAHVIVADGGVITCPDCRAALAGLRAAADARPARVAADEIPAPCIETRSVTVPLFRSAPASDFTLFG